MEYKKLKRTHNQYVVHLDTKKIKSQSPENVTVYFNPPLQISSDVAPQISCQYFQYFNKFNVHKNFEDNYFDIYTSIKLVRKYKYDQEVKDENYKYYLHVTRVYFPNGLSLAHGLNTTNNTYSNYFESYAEFNPNAFCNYNLDLNWIDISEEVETKYKYKIKVKSNYVIGDHLVVNSTENGAGPVINDADSKINCHIYLNRPVDENTNIIKQIQFNYDIDTQKYNIIITYKKMLDMFELHGPPDNFIENAFQFNYGNKPIFKLDNVFIRMNPKLQSIFGFCDAEAYSASDIFKLNLQNSEIKDDPPPSVIIEYKERILPDETSIKLEIEEEYLDDPNVEVKIYTASITSEHEVSDFLETKFYLRLLEIGKNVFTMKDDKAVEDNILAMVPIFGNIGENVYINKEYFNYYCDLPENRDIDSLTFKLTDTNGNNLNTKTDFHWNATFVINY